MLFDRGIIAPNETVDGNWEKSGYMHLGSEPWLKVNLNGERFSNESVPYDLSCTQPLWSRAICTTPSTTATGWSMSSSSSRSLRPH